MPKYLKSFKGKNFSLKTIEGHIIEGIIAVKNVPVLDKYYRMVGTKRQYSIINSCGDEKIFYSKGPRRVSLEKGILVEKYRTNVKSSNITQSEKYRLNEKCQNT